MLEPVTKGWLMAQRVDVAFVCDDASSNAMGRAYSLWLLSSSLGHTTVTIAWRGDTLWEPLATTDYASTVRLALNGRRDVCRDVSPRLIVCVKPLPDGARAAISWSRRSGRPLMFDIDEPDVEAGLSQGDPVKSAVKAVVRPRRSAFFRWASKNIRRFPLTVSNPYLQERYGGRVVPHVRADLASVGRREPTRVPPTVAFVGTLRRHKGVRTLRNAVASLQAYGYELVVTDTAPDDARPWESWLGRTSLSEGLRTVGMADIVALPSEETPFASGQLPAKLIDAMSLGRSIIASDLPPIRWALEDGGLLVPPGNERAFEAGLLTLYDPEVRRAYGMRAQELSSRFSVGSNIEAWDLAVQDAVGAD